MRKIDDRWTAHHTSGLFLAIVLACIAIVLLATLVWASLFCMGLVDFDSQLSNVMGKIIGLAGVVAAVSHVIHKLGKDDDHAQD